MPTDVLLSPPALPSAGAATPSELCAPALLLGTQLRASHEFGDPAATRRGMRDLLDRTEAQLRAGSMPEPDVQDVLFALTAFLDESVVRSTWEHKADWLTNPMQFERFRRYDAGEEFFARLDRLRAERAVHTDVLEVYFLCLMLDFKGKYQLLPERAWEELVAETGAYVRRVDGRAAPAPVRAHTSESLADAAREMPAWVFAVAVAAVAFVLYLVLSLIVRTRLDAVAELLRA